MSKELPYFKFFPNEWMSGDITLEAMSLQGIFINVCSTYWSKDCNIEIAKLKARYGKAIATLLENGLIKEEQGFCVISFLDEQWEELSKYHKKNVESGKKGAEKRWGSHSDPNSPPIAYREEESKGEKIRKDNNIEERKASFIHEVSFFRNKYNDDMLQSFAEYWMEHNVGGKKMRFEMEKVFQVERRLLTWNKNQSKFKQNGQSKPTANDFTEEWRKQTNTASFD